VRPTITQRLNGVVRGAIKQIAVNQPFESDVSACFAPVLHPQSHDIVGFKHSWLVTVSIPNPLAGPDDIAVSIPLHGVVPPAAMFEDIAKRLFDRCMEQKRELKPPEDEPTPLQDFAGTKPAIKGEVLESKTEPVKPKVTRERESHFPSKPGSGDLSAD
jgi:hypothetical protein